MTFKSLGIQSQFVKSLDEQGITKPTEIQQAAIPALLKSHTDFIGKAQTGTGKTIAFGLPLLDRVDPTRKEVQALILCPTRELGQQIAKQLFKLTKYSDKIFTEAVYGGEKIDRQIDRLKRPTHVVVATPGRLIDLVKRRAVTLNSVDLVVLDEADEMLTMGFKKELDSILSTVGEDVTKWLFSATMPKGIQQIVKSHLSPDAVKVEMGQQATNPNILHQFAICEPAQKQEALMYFLKTQKGNRGIVFCRTKRSTQALHTWLSEQKVKANCIHGDMQQKDREKVMRAFKKDQINVLIATDISARGIDVADLAYVFHYELPDQAEYYAHRSGRTARAGKKGVSVALIAPNEQKYLNRIGAELKINFKRLQ